MKALETCCIADCPNRIVEGIRLCEVTPDAWLLAVMQGYDINQCLFDRRAGSSVIRWPHATFGDQPFHYLELSCSRALSPFLFFSCSLSLHMFIIPLSLFSCLPFFSPVLVSLATGCYVNAFFFALASVFVEWFPVHLPSLNTRYCCVFCISRL